MFLPFGSFGDLTTTSIFKATDKALEQNHNITRAVGHILGGVVALELQQTASRAKGKDTWSTNS